MPEGNITKKTNIDELPIVPLNDTERMRRYFWGEEQPRVDPRSFYPIVLREEDFQLPHIDFRISPYQDIEPMV